MKRKRLHFGNYCQSDNDLQISLTDDEIALLKQQFNDLLKSFGLAVGENTPRSPGYYPK